MDALKQARDRLAARIRDPRAVAFGLSSDLKAISNALDALEDCCDQLAASNIVALAELYEVGPSSRKVPATMVELSKFGKHSANAYRVVTHGRGCHCEECM